MKILELLAYFFYQNKFFRSLGSPVWHIYLNIKGRKLQKLYHKNAELVLHKAYHAFNSRQLNCWLDFGTLLGAYRERDFIMHDCDIDLGAFYEDKEEITQSLKENGFKLVKEYIVGNGIEGCEQTYEYLGVSMDMFYYFMDDIKTMHCNSFSLFENEAVNPYAEVMEVQVKKITLPYNGFTTMLFKDIQVNVPNKIEIHLKAHYGKNFMVPNKNFDYRKEAQNVYTYSRSEKVGTCLHFY